MQRAFLATAISAFILAACGQPPSTASQQFADAALGPAVDVASHAGQSYEAFTRSTGMGRFALNKLDLSPAERTRLSRAMAQSQPSRLLSGGGAQALVFVGCAQGGCATGTAVLAFGDHGETFAGVRDGAGVEQFIADDRLEALLRLSSPTRRWDDPGGAASAGESAAP